MDTIIRNVSEHVHGLFTNLSKRELTYHNLTHTANVVARSIEIINHYGLSPYESLVIQIAAWFHDVGYLITGMRGHENASVLEMKRFFAASTTDQTTIQQIGNCIMSTQQPINPSGLLEEIICDADTYHVGTSEFLAADEAVRKELFPDNQITDDEWNSSTLNFLLQHRYFTTYCKEKLQEGKNIHIQLVRAKIMNPELRKYL